MQNEIMLSHAKFQGLSGSQNTHYLISGRKIILKLFRLYIVDFSEQNFGVRLRVFAKKSLGSEIGIITLLYIANIFRNFFLLFFFAFALIFVLALSFAFLARYLHPYMYNILKGF